MIHKIINSKFRKLAILFSICLTLNNTLTFNSYAMESIAVAESPLFIPITTFVTAVLIGSGMIAKNSQESLNAGGQLVKDIISQIKSSEVAKSEANPDYDSPFRVINGGKSEKPNNDNKNGKWFAAAGGALAAHEIYASKDAIKDIMSKANSLGGYKTSYTQTGIVSSDDLLSQSTASNIALQLAKLSNSSVTQFDKFLHSDFWEKNNLSPDDCFFNVGVNYLNLNKPEPLYPTLEVHVFKKSDLFKNILIKGNPFRYLNYKNDYLTFSGYYVYTSTDYVTMLNEDNVAIREPYWQIRVDSRTPDKTFSYYVMQSSVNNPYFKVYSDPNFFYFGYIWTNQNPIQFTNNVYNVNMSFDENFKNWLQGQIQGLGGQIIDAVRLGVTSINPSWNPNQEQIQAGTTPDNVIYQFINNYENPENVPDEPKPNPDPDPEPTPEPAPEPVPDNEYLGSFLLPESITTKFPFCIPFDVARCFRLFSTSDREAPRWECDIGYGSSKYHVVIDLSLFNDVASFIRPLEYIVFLVGLAIGTRSLIRG